MLRVKVELRACKVYEMVVCNGLGIRRDNMHVSPGDISYFEVYIRELPGNSLYARQSTLMSACTSVLPPSVPTQKPLPACPNQNASPKRKFRNLGDSLAYEGVQ